MGKKRFRHRQQHQEQQQEPKQLGERKPLSADAPPPPIRRVCQFPLPFPAHLPVPKHDFLRNEPPFQESFRMAIQTAYEGLEVDLTLPPSSNNKKNHNQIIINESTVQQALHEMESMGFFRTDVTQPFGLGTKCAKTYVTRCLVGAPGTTYKYLGLRMFAFSWDDTACDTIDDNDDDNNNHHPTTPAVRPLQIIYQLKQVLKERTRRHLKALQERRRQRAVLSNPVSSMSSAKSSVDAVGRDEFDICLINRMEYSPALKMEPTLQQHRTAVSWHADSSLEHYSSIAVYHTLTTSPSPPPTTTTIELEQPKKRHKNKNAVMADEACATRAAGGGGWSVALRVSPNAEGPDASHKRDGGHKESGDEDDYKEEESGDNDHAADQLTPTTVPPIAVSLPSGSTYYLLDDFNHHHQHAVLTEENEPATPTVRFSCTYRLLRTSHNVDFVLERGLRTCRNFHKKGIKMWRSEQLLLTEMESDWIRQFYIQGQEHHNLLWKNWKEPMQGLLRYWSQLEVRTKQTIDLLTSGAASRCQSECAASSSSVASNHRSERKLRDKRKKAYQTLQELLTRSDSSLEDHTNAAQLLFEPFAVLLEERATMRELWAQREKEHVFQELTPEFRPLQVPLDFGVADSSTTPGAADVNVTEQGRSPLKGTPRDLRGCASMLRACGLAFASGRVEDLPIDLAQLNDKDHAGHNAGDDNLHTKPIDWNGWQQPLQFALEMQSPWAKLLLEGKKTIETRAYPLPNSLLGKKIWILQSPKGADGVSSTPNLVDLSEDGGVVVVGWCKISSVKTYTKKNEFEYDERAHMVTSKSGYGWVQGKTQTLYGWVLKEYGSCDVGESTRFASATRRMRSLFELERAVGRHQNGDLPSSNTIEKRSRGQSSSEKKNKKRKRF